jgi:hypothetical protein
MADKWFRCVTVSGGLEKEMLELSCDASDIKNAIGPLCALQIDHDDVEPFSKEKIAWGRITVHQHLLVFPHVLLIAPLVTQPKKFGSIILAHRIYSKEPRKQPVQIDTIIMHIDRDAVSGAIMERGEKISE